MLKGKDNKCGFGFHVVEDLEAGKRCWKVVVFPYEDACRSIELPRTKEEFVKTAESLGIEWDINNVLDLDDFRWV